MKPGNLYKVINGWNFGQRKAFCLYQLSSVTTNRFDWDGADYIKIGEYFILLEKINKEYSLDIIILYKSKIWRICSDLGFFNDYFEKIHT